MCMEGEFFFKINKRDSTFIREMRVIGWELFLEVRYWDWLQNFISWFFIMQLEKMLYETNFQLNNQMNFIWPRNNLQDLYHMCK